MNDIPSILTIAGSDSCGGAGIQADLKTFSMLGTYGASVITALTAQNTQGVDAIHAAPAKFVAQQLKAVLTDLDIRAAKTGMLFSKAIISAVAPFLKQKQFPLVVDPVCVSQSGQKLLQDSAVTAMVNKIFPHADLLTPNLPETELFTGIRIHTQDDVEKAADKLLAMGPRAVLIKGGHAEQSVAVTDWLATPGQKPLPYMQPRVKTKNNHGTGCTLSAAIAAQLGLGLDLPKAVRAAQQYLNLALRASFDIGNGAGPPNHLAPMLREHGRDEALSALVAIGFDLEGIDGLSRLLPAGLAHVGLALAWADSKENVAAFTGGLVPGLMGRVEVAGCPCFGASAKAAAVLLAALKVRPDLNCVLTLGFDDAILKAVKRAGIVAAVFDRSKEPHGLGRDEVATLEWGVMGAVSSHPQSFVVGAVYDRGAPGVAGGVRLLGKNGLELVEMVRAILDEIKG